jgi:hypothetical protein
MGTDKPWRESDEALSTQGEQEFSTSHIFEPTVWLPPVPFLAEDFGDMFSASIPMSVNSGLNEGEIRVSDCSFSDGKGEHSYYIAKRMLGRQQKMQGNEKKLTRDVGREFGRIFGLK